jgi:hypothetical protein
MSCHSAQQFVLEFHPELPVVVETSAVRLSSEGGLLLIREFDERLGFTEPFAAALPTSSASVARWRSPQWLTPPPSDLSMTHQIQPGSGAAPLRPILIPMNPSHPNRSMAGMKHPGQGDNVPVTHSAATRGGSLKTTAILNSISHSSSKGARRRSGGWGCRGWRRFRRTRAIPVR